MSAPRPGKASKAVTWIAACTALTGAFEGCNLQAKVDTIGTGHPVTWCHGETIGAVAVGQRFTPAECDAMLAARLPQYWNAIEPCIHVETSDNEKIAYTSASYNIGSGAFCNSAMARKLNAGDHAGACDALMLYTHANGRVVRGLVNRRAAERKICLTPDAVAVDRAPALPNASERPAELPPAPPAPPPAKVWAHWWSKFFSWSWWCE
jgi:lysozyme